MKRVYIGKYWRIVIVGLTSFLALLFLLLNILSLHGDYTWNGFIINVLKMSPFLFIVTLLDYKILEFVNSSRRLSKNGILRILSETTTLVFITLVFIFLANFLLFEDREYLFRYMRSPIFMISIFVSVIINIFIVALLEIFIQIKRNDKLQKLNLEIEYQQLKSQVNPHFLFNSLNVLVSLINKDSGQATAYTQKLSEVYRYVLAQNQKRIIYLGDEIDFINLYVEILRIRYGDVINCDIDISEEDLLKMVPPMSLQLLIENAVKHNTVTAKNLLKIKIKAEDNYVVVSNNVTPRVSAHTDAGVGLLNLERKYQIIADRDISVAKSDEEFVVKLPLL